MEACLGAFAAAACGWPAEPEPFPARAPVGARAEVVAVREASPGRADPPCPFVAAGCGGCGWQHVAPDAQRQGGQKRQHDAEGAAHRPVLQLQAETDRDDQVLAVTGEVPVALDLVQAEVVGDLERQEEDLREVELEPDGGADGEGDGEEGVAMAGLDLGVVVIYLALVLGAGVYFSKRASQDLDAYFLGGRRLHWSLLAMSGAVSNFDAVSYTHLTLPTKRIV